MPENICTADINCVNINVQSAWVQQNGLTENANFWTGEETALYRNYDGNEGILSQDMKKINQYAGVKKPDNSTMNKMNAAIQEFNLDNTKFQNSQSMMNAVLKPITALASNMMSSFVQSVTQWAEPGSTVNQAVTQDCQSGLV